MATEFCEVYRCKVCGNIVEVLQSGAGELVCCGVPMTRLDANTVDASREKHVPAVEASDRGLLVKIGSAPHPMISEHFIEWIELIDGDRIERRHLKPGEAPQAFFACPCRSGVTVRAYCNLHGLWKN